LNWKGKPLINYETIINLIGGTRTRTGLKVKAVLDTNRYETGIEVSAQEDESRSGKWPFNTYCRNGSPVVG
jgi:hypothetical protein